MQSIRTVCAGGMIGPHGWFHRDTIHLRNKYAENTGIVCVCGYYTDIMTNIWEDIGRKEGRKEGTCLSSFRLEINRFLDTK